jgi:hypothetical protein
MDDDVNRMGVVRSIESELLDVRSRIGNEKYAIPVFWCQTIPKWPWQILRAVLPGDEDYDAAGRCQRVLT